jgi:uncharacterized protein (TIGR02266 family)
MEPSGGDRRRDLRVPLLLRIDFPGSPGLGDATENLSAGGLFIRTDRPLPPGTRVPLILSFPGLLEPVELEVEVTWRRDAEGESPAGCAVRIPADRAEDREKLARLVRSAQEPREPAPARRSYRVLLVEDNPLLLAMYEAAMKRLRTGDGSIDVAVEWARDGIEALARLQRKPKVELVVVDLYMPVMDGFTLVEKVRSDPGLMLTPIVAISAGGDEARARAVDGGVDVYLQKPVHMKQILETVRALLRIQG